MEAWILKLIDSSPYLGAFIAFWYIQRKDYKELVSNTQSENLKREEKYQITIDKLTDRLNTVDDVKAKVNNIETDITEIKEYIRR